MSFKTLPTLVGLTRRPNRYCLWAVRVHADDPLSERNSMDFTIRQLIYAEAAAEFGNFTHAARHLGVTQASISTAIFELEQRVGTKLYDRHSSRGVTLTPVGERFIHEVRILLGHVKRFQTMAERLKAQHSGEIAMIGSSPPPDRRKRLNQEKKRSSHLLIRPL